jgi:hypothetical protein
MVSVAQPTNGHTLSSTIEELYSDHPTVTAAQQAARTAWRDAVADVAAKAKQTLPECTGRVDSAVKIVLNGDVELLPDGKARVASQSNGETVYHLANGECTCKDFAKAPSGWCKHRIARGLHIRAAALSAAEAVDASSALTVDLDPDVLAQPHIAALPEAPASVNVRLVISGREVQWTLRDTDEARLAERLTALLARYPMPEPAPRSPQQHNAKAMHRPTTEPTTDPAPAGSMPRCQLHGEALRLRRGKDGRQRRSHRLADGTYCQGM